MCHLRFPTQGSNPRPLHWKRGVFTTGLLGKCPLLKFLAGVISPRILGYPEIK